MTEQPKLMALDLGERRIGLAVSGPGGLVLPAGHIVRGNLAHDVQEVIAAASQRQAKGIVVGLPYTLQGETGPSAKLARGFIRALRQAIGAGGSLAVYELDERCPRVAGDGRRRGSGGGRVVGCVEPGPAPGLEG